MAPLPRIAHHLASFARFRADRDERERSDAQAMRELAADPPLLARGLELEWLGVAGYRLSFEDETLYIDPFLSRVPFSSVFRRAPALADPALHDRFLRPRGRVAGVLVGHTHFDHAIDVPEIARRHECSAFGSRSTTSALRRARSWRATSTTSSARSRARWASRSTSTCRRFPKRSPQSAATSRWQHSSRCGQYRPRMSATVLEQGLLARSRQLPRRSRH